MNDPIQDPSPDPDRDPVLAHALAHRDATIARLKTLIRCPSVGADPGFAQGMEDARRLIETRLAEIGFDRIQRLEGAAGHPAIYAEKLGDPDRPTILVYAHYDVQPPDPLDKWTTPPFEPVEKEGRLYGRGASDDKGPSMIALETLAAFLAVENALPINIAVEIEMIVEVED